MKKQTYKDIIRAFKALDKCEELLDQIRSEIVRYYQTDIVNEYVTGKNYGLYIAIQIIDAYKAKMKEV